MENIKAIYTDGEIEDELIRTLDKGDDVFSIPYKGGAVFHNFTDARENLINWYPFAKNSKVLEIGAGMGALTGILCEQCESVVAFEQSAKRAEIIRKRHSDRSNLEVVCGDVFTYDFQQKFDYILLIGVLEYVGVNSTEGNPYENILKKVNSLLNSNGTLLLAIENQYGLKYWCGAAEDHTGIPFDGIAGYINNGYTTRYNKEGVRTFSREYLKKMLLESNFSFQRWYYPLPDYKFPMAIFSDEYLPEMSDIEAIKFNYPIESELISEEKKLYKEVIENNVFPFFANSFFIEAKVKENSGNYVKYASFKRDYKKEYRVATIIDNEKNVIKRCIHRESIAHLKRYINIAEILKARGISVVEVAEGKNEIVQKWQELTRTDKILNEYFMEDNWDAAVGLIDELKKNIRKSSECYMSKSCNMADRMKIDFENEEEIMLDGYIDMTFVNSFYKDEQIVFFDQEWKYSNVPIKFILYRAIKYAYKENCNVALERLYEYAGIGKELIKQFECVESKMLIGMMDENKCKMFDPGMYHEGLTLNYKIAQLNNKNNEIVEKYNQLSQNYQKQILDSQHQNDEQLKIIDEQGNRIKEYRDIIKECQDTIKEKQDTIEKHQNKINNLCIEIESKESCIAEKEQMIRNKEGHIELLLEVERSYEREKHTHAYKLAKRMQRVGNFLLPPNSRRRFFLRIVFNIFKNPRLMFHVINPKRIKNYLKYMKKEGMEGVKIRYEEAVSIEKMRTNLESQLELEVVEVKKDKTEENNLKIEDFEKIIFQVWNKPTVSIVIPVYNEFQYTYRCLKSIYKNSGNIAYEIIIANDCSTDITNEIEKIAENVRLITTKENVRFLLNCNNAAKYAKGKYILFLNNDTQVQENWLQPLVDLIESDDTIGMVGSKLVYPDGTLQEAGGILWNDASAWNYGNRKNPEDPEYNYVKETDYISGASIMIRTNLWNEIGGFDEQFAPAYCEDSDLAFEVRKKGYKVVYQPLSIVVHFEGISNGTDVNSGQKSYQVINKEKFEKKWKNILQNEHFPNGEKVFVARDRNREKPVLLMIDHYVPQYDKDAGSRTVFQYLKLFVSMGFNVKFIGDNFYRHEPYTTVLQQMGIEVLYGAYYANNWQEWIKNNSEFIQYVFLNRPHISVKYIDFIRKNTNARIIYYGHDLHFLREMRKYELTQDKKALEDSADWKQKEIELMRKADVVYYPSEIEVNEIAKIDDSIHAKAIIAYIFDNVVSKKYHYEKRKDIMFIGGFTHTPNVDAVLWFTKEVFPSVLKVIPDIKIYILGSNPPLEIKNLENENIVVKGFVSDEELENFYCNCRISVVPLRYGAGIKGKVIEAMSYGVPVLTTTVGAEGIIGAEKILKIADEPETLANALIDLYNNEEKLIHISEASYQYIRDVFSKENAWKIIEEDFEIRR